MVPKVKDILGILEEMAPPSMAEDWDNPGLQVGDPNRPVKKILVSLDPTLRALRDAGKRKVDLLLSHHPLLFRPISQIDETFFPGNVVAEACRRGISILAAHTNLDATRGGISDGLADLLDLQNIQVLQKKQPGDSGLGRIGHLPEPLTLRFLIQKVKNILGTSCVRVSGHEHTVIRRVAVVGGAGGELVAAASELGADLLITGDIRHHEALLAQDLGLSLMDAGHYETEKPALLLFAEKLLQGLKEAGWDVSLDVYTQEEAPMRYE